MFFCRSDFGQKVSVVSEISRKSYKKNVYGKWVVMSRIGSKNSKHNGQIPFVNINISSKYTKRTTKNKKIRSLVMYFPTFILLILNTASRNTCLLETHIAFKIPVI